MKQYTYTKDTGEVSDRVLHILGGGKVQNFSALDLTEVEPEIRAVVVDLYNQWTREVFKAYQAEERKFRKENLTEFREWLVDFVEESKVPGTLVKNFKPGGLVELAVVGGLVEEQVGDGL